MAIDVKELMAKVGKIRILTNRLIDDQLAGDYHSTFKGQGVEFDEVRPYPNCSEGGAVELMTQTAPWGNKRADDPVVPRTGEQ